MISISKPILGHEEEQAVLRVLRSGKLTQGEVVRQFEEEFATYVGTKHAIAASNGTTALHLSLLAAGIGPGDEVITTAFTFIASANAILYTGAKPVFVDIEEDTFNINPDLIEKKITPKTKAIMPVDLYGLPANMKAIAKIAREHKLSVIEDACQAHGATINNKKTGSYGLAGCFSFYATKNMTTGEGGMVTTNNSQFAEKIRLLRSHGMKKRYYHDYLGYNFRMTEMEAAMGIEQLKKLEVFNSKRIANAGYLTKKLHGIPGIITPTVPSGYRHVFHQYTIKITPEFGSTREDLMKTLEKDRVDALIYYPLPVHKQAVYKKIYSGDRLPVTEKISSQVLSLPIHPGVERKDLERIAELIRGAKPHPTNNK